MTSTSSTALARYAVSRNFSRALHVVGFTSLAGAAVQVVAYQLAHPALVLWPALLALLPLTIGLILLDRIDRMSVSIMCLIAGAATVYGHTYVVESQLHLSAQTALVLPSIALVMLGASGVGPAAGLRSCLSGYIASQVAANAAHLQLTGGGRFDPITTGVFLVSLFVLTLAYLNQRRAERLSPRFQRAATDELVSTLRFRLELKAAALMHDTVLSHLTAIAGGSGDRLPEALSDQIERDLSVLASPQWLEEPPPFSPTSDDDWRRSPVYAAVRESRALGLEVGVTGDTSAVLRLDCERAIELGRAVKQCLVNVQKHAGTLDAEVAVYGSDDEVLVMVVDTGDGFTAQEGTSDRLGLKTSVRGRIEALGGSVQVWSTPGRGTSIVLRVPVVEPVPDPEVVGASGTTS